MTDSGNNSHGMVLEFSAKPFSEPAVEQFNGAGILDRVSDFIRRYVHLSDAQARVCAVWVAHTHALGAAAATLYLNINSAAKQSGKTRLLEVFELLAAKPWLTGRVSAACLIRKVDQVRPSLLLDECDAAFQGEKEYAEALRGILNTGYTSAGVASCCVGQGANVTYKDFKTFCAKAIAGIGSSLPDTVADRSIPIRLERKRPGEVVARFRRRKAKEEAWKLKGELSDWMNSITDRLKEAEPALPEELTDRQQDGLEPLLAIADEAGGDWPAAVRQAAVNLCRSPEAEDQNTAMQLLTDIRSIFDALGEDKISSADLLEKLKEIETSPWCDWSKGKGLTRHGLSRLLKPFGIRPHGTVRTGETTAKGYVSAAFAEAWERYLPRDGALSRFSSVTTSQPAPRKAFEPFSIRHKKINVTDQNPSQPVPVADCDVVTVQKGGCRGGDANQGTFPQTLPSCGRCGSCCLYREKDGSVTCETCGGRS